MGEVVDAVLEGLPAASGEPVGPEPIAFRGAGTTAAVRAPEADVAVVTLAFPAPMQSAELDAALSALIGGDGSRLFERVREEEGASYGLEWGSIALLPDLQLVTIGGAAPPERAGEVVAMVREELSRLRAEGVTGPELDAAREERLAAEREVLADPGTVTSVLLDQVLLGRGPDPALFARGAALGVEGVNAALPELLPEAVAAVVVTPRPRGRRRRLHRGRARGGRRLRPLIDRAGTVRRAASGGRRSSGSPSRAWPGRSRMPSAGPKPGVSPLRPRPAPVGVGAQRPHERCGPPAAEATRPSAGTGPRASRRLGGATGWRARRRRDGPVPGSL